MSRTGRLVRCVIATVVAVFLVHQAILAGLAASHNLPGNYVAALRLQPSSGEAASKEASIRLAEGDAAKSEVLARQALTVSPLNVAAVRTMGLVRESQGREAESRRLMTAAGALGWRDPATQLWLMRRSLAVGDYQVAVERADALLRRDLFVDELFPVLRQVAAEPGGAPALAARLADDPHWRQRFLMRLTDLKPEQWQGHEALLKQLAGGATPARKVELIAYTKRLFDSGQRERAYRQFISYLGAGPSAPVVTDGSFTLIATAPPDEPRFPFEWTVPKVFGVSMEFDVPPAPIDGVALRVRTDGSAAGLLMSQVLHLGPGRYVMAVAARPSDRAAAEGFRWTVQCIDGGNRVAAGPTASENHRQWILLKTALQIPPGCTPRLELRAQNIGAGIESWFDRISIQPAAPSKDSKVAPDIKTPTVPA